MWTKTFKKTYENITPQQVWRVWTDTPNWPQWNPGIEACRMDEAFKAGSQFTLKPKGGKSLTLTLVAVEKERIFTDCIRFPGAKMFGHHEIKQTGKGVTLVTTTTIRGPLSFLWRKIVGEKVAAKIPIQTDALVELARKHG